MRNFQQKQGLSRILESPLVLAVLFIILLFFAWGVIRFMGKLASTSKNRQNAFTKVEGLRLAQERFSGEIESLKTPKGIEENIREKFPVVKEGEGLIMVVEDKNANRVDENQDKNWFELMLQNWFK